MPGKFTGKVVVVSGGSRGIGRARHIQGTAIAVDGGATVGYY